MAIITTTTIIDRFVTLLETYLNAEVNSIDTDNNAVAGAAEQFVTPTITTSAISPFRDDERTSALTVAVWEPKGSEFEFETLPIYAQEGGGTNVPHFNRRHFFNASIRCDVQDTSDAGIHGAYRICNRVADGVLVVAYKYPEMSIPATSVAGLVGITELQNYGEPQDPQDTSRVSRVLEFSAVKQDVRT